MQPPETPINHALRVPLTARSGIATFSVFVVGYMTANLVPLMIIAMVDDLGVSQTVAGAVLTGSLLACAVVCLATTRWAAGQFRRRLGRAGLVVMAAGFAAAAVVPSAPIACIAIVVGGLGAGGAVAVGGAAMAAFTNPNRVSGLSGLVNRVAVTGVLALIPILGTRMTNAFGIVAVLALATALTMTWLPTAPDLGAGTTRTRAELPEGVTRKRVTVAGASLLVLFAVWAIGEDSLWAVSGIMGFEHAGLTEQQMGLALSASTAGGIGIALLLTALGSRLGRTVPVAVLLVLGAALKLGSCLTTEPTTYLVLIITWNTVYAAAFIYVVAIAAALDSSGRWSAPLLGTYLVGSAFAPLFGTLVTEAVGYPSFGVIVAGISLVLLLPITAIAALSARTEATSLAVGQDPTVRYTTSVIV